MNGQEYDEINWEESHIVPARNDIGFGTIGVKPFHASRDERNYSVAAGDLGPVL